MNKLVAFLLLVTSSSFAELIVTKDYCVTKEKVLVTDKEAMIASFRQMDKTLTEPEYAELHKKMIDAFKPLCKQATVMKSSEKDLLSAFNRKMAQIGYETSMKKKNAGAKK